MGIIVRLRGVVFLLIIFVISNGCNSSEDMWNSQRSIEYFLIIDTCKQDPSNRFSPTIYFKNGSMYREGFGIEKSSLPNIYANCSSGDTLYKGKDTLLFQLKKTNGQVIREYVNIGRYDGPKKILK